MGQFIVIDGLDGSGKETQSNLLADRLKSLGKKVKLLSYPRYGTPGAVPVELYLNGGLGGRPEDTNAYAASAFFGIDRYLSYRTEWYDRLNDPDSVVIANRYTSANAVHQMTKLPQSEWDAFLEWLWDFEFEKLAIPRPDCVIYLEMLPELSHRLIQSRSDLTGAKQDIHEKSPDHLEKAYRAAMYASEKLGWKRIRCYAGDPPEPKRREEIAEEVTASAGF